MPDFVLPPYQIDPAALPPPLLNSEADSFARHTISVRIPRIAEETIEENSFPVEIRSRLAALRAEILGGTVQPLLEGTPDRDFWNQVSAPYLGHSWLDAPWYWSETYFYRRILEATTYFQPGPWQGFDPFAASKRTEWQPDGAPAAVAALLPVLPADPGERFVVLLQASLWGNRIDLSYKSVSAQFSGAAGAAAHEPGDSSNLLVDDTRPAWSRLAGSSGGARVTLVADNAGTELAMDLVLIDFLLREGLAREVCLHLKGQPFFVSDAMPADLEACLVALQAAGEAPAGVARRLREQLSAGRLLVLTHWAYTTPLFYFQLPAGLQAEFAANDLVIFKGDANYRRLLGDAHWPFTGSFAAATAYFPAPLVALRTLKSELIMGLAPGQAERLQQADPAWLVNGRRGVIQGSRL